MSAAPTLRRAPQTPEIGQLDHRLNPRYPVNLELQYKLVGADGVQHAGGGRSINIGSRGVLMETDDAITAYDILRCCGTIELTMNWPLMLNGASSLKVVVRGQIVRKDHRRLAIKIEQQIPSPGVGSKQRTKHRGAYSG